ncbi:MULTISPECIES: ABC-F family ATP-binding cassette domain-containing protein [Aerococcus]|uniref:ATP-binding cassette domain-containing protein n=1 Tax=Aerococcus sanguinicola TaxID=119206 RepID=A0A5N1GL35_9LACT|nr:MULTISPECIES: ATP-binding cassette domain-containing protein [Aerococcus]KAA9301695.1 ATP-binding cassette domain-containing protein [Aerococcus sanguinicola]MDK6368892.1 ATP-binding cassette domain-containing protein [Aerococcus sp. UMB9870]MDK6680230.1 ATP-binding cassette domain-containing protein [Aerococcus sp. UMB8608]MDK6687295.1 ATP-binding cassette domain-containing protein [Aerococcus sp. UMB8623]MDK6940392.1 ATP-binding cassette domain-containing protein [Aerococcus sp. UMB8487]
MLTVSNVSLHFSDRKLYDNVNLKFTPGNCYGIIGANGAGKSTFLKILSGEIQPSTGQVNLDPNERLSVLSQNHFGFEDYTVIDTVIMGNKELYDIKNEKDAIYAKADFTEEDGIRAGELEAQFAEMNGWEAESEAAQLLTGLGIEESVHNQLMSELDEKDKVKVLLAQALFGNPDVLLLDEPTNGLDAASIEWLADYLIDYENTVIVVSHDRYFLNRVCTHICDVDFGRIQLYVGNYDFWKQSSELAAKLQADANAKKEEKVKELKEFIARFSANASKSKQATSRKKMLDKIELDDIQPSSRKYPFVGFEPEREIGNDVLTVEGLSKTIDGVKVLDNITFNLKNDDKVAFVSRNDASVTALFKIIMGEMEPDTGTYKWGVTTSQAYLPRDSSNEFDGRQDTILEWLRQYAKTPEEQDNTFLRSFLGRMLFSGDDVNKQVDVLSGGEKVRCLLSKMMLSKANVLVMDDPTNHLDLESITSLNEGLIRFNGVLLFSSHDREFLSTIANRVIHVSGQGMVDRIDTGFEDYLNNADTQERVDQLYQ